MQFIDNGSGNYVDVYEENRFIDIHDEPMEPELWKKLETASLEQRRASKSRNNYKEILTPQMTKVATDMVQNARNWNKAAEENTKSSIRDSMQSVHPKLLITIMYHKATREIIMKLSPAILSNKNKLYELKEIDNLCKTAGMFPNNTKNNQVIDSAINIMAENPKITTYPEALYFHISSLLAENDKSLGKDSFAQELQLTNDYISSTIEHVVKRYNMHSLAEKYKTNKLKGDQVLLQAVEERKKALEKDIEMLNVENTDGIVEDHLVIIIIVNVVRDKDVIKFKMVNYHFITV